MRELPALGDARPVDYLLVIAAHKWIILAMVLLSVTVAAFKVSALPVLHEANITIIAAVPAWEDRVGKQIRPVIPNLGLRSRPIRITLFESFYWELFSRVLADAVIEELDLKRHYGVNSIGQARAILMANRLIQLSREYTLQVTVTDRDPAMAAAIANAHARQLERLDRKLLAESASLRRRFFEQEVEGALTALRQAELAWSPNYYTEDLPLSLEVDKKKQAAVQFASSMPNLSVDDKKTDLTQETAPPQTLTIAIVTKLQLMQLEVELVRLWQFATLDHPAVNQIEARIQALQRILERETSGTEKQAPRQNNPAPKRGLRGLFPSLERIPELALNNDRLAREVSLRAKVYTEWRFWLEDAATTEVLDLPRVWVLEEAAATERPKKIWQTLLVAGGLALILGVMCAFFLAHVARLRRLEEYYRSVPQGKAV